MTEIIKLIEDCQKELRDIKTLVKRKEFKNFYNEFARQREIQSKLWNYSVKVGGLAMKHQKNTVQLFKNNQSKFAKTTI